MREGAALLQGIAKCGRCGRGLRVYYSGRNSAPGYYCAGSTVSNGRGEWCLASAAVKSTMRWPRVFEQAVRLEGAWSLASATSPLSAG